MNLRHEQSAIISEWVVLKVYPEVSEDRNGLIIVWKFNIVILCPCDHAHQNNSDVENLEVLRVVDMIGVVNMCMITILCGVSSKPLLFFLYLCPCNDNYI